MDQNLNYQRARRIRGADFSSILADQMLYEPTVQAAIKRTISLKIQARAKGLAEKVDPLNIAKMLTFGSRFGPSLLGKMTGRTKQDIEYFTGRLKPVAVRTGSKVTKVPKEGEELVEGKNVSIAGTGGINEQLLKIYKFLKVSKQFDIKRREMEHNFDEERSMESERRHKELMKTLDKLMDRIKMLEGGVPKAEKVETPAQETQSIWQTLVAEALPFIGEMALGSVARASSVLVAFLAPWMLNARERRKIEENPYAPEYKDNPYAMTLRGEAETQKQAGAINQRKALKQVRRSEIEDVVKSDLDDKTVKEEYGATKSELMDWLKDPNNKVWQAPTERTPSTLQRLGIDESKAGAGRGTAQLADYERQQLEAAGSAAAGAMRQDIKATPATTPGNNERLNTAMAENADSQLPKLKSEDSVIINNVTRSANKQTRQLDKLSELGVRNDEPTLLRMIMASTRVV